ncbi:hypothetical protein CEUSTIGMA_g710.t1 [Chlamydomonas eustigma]|uniref:Glycosyltransferase-like protein LARGE2 n=1 Tax=Chlamydomonas eustigma TaxID=1157962 RepID=A0A250WRD1_9CHLO|nr:hypothetical protein CEUSTIGMA_g710.t1 [Chlamydomonas eustigma]|eukprot:GAX73256.1 hypothetical protein CEUSTIGMA_g710.t1 [Chlamydomonas eustigma]
MQVAGDKSDQRPVKSTDRKTSPEHVLKSAIEKARKFHGIAEDALPCQLDLLLAYERFNESRATMLYPMNILRNYARLQARTHLIGLFDVDMLPSLSLYQDLADPEVANRYFSLTEGSREFAPSVLVIPAFITFDARTDKGNFSAEQISDRMVIAEKKELLTLWQYGVINRFDPMDRGHNATQYERWLQATEQYEVKYEYRYEPWVICDRMMVPWYDSRFRGYGQNKIVHLENMNWTGYKFRVHPKAWLIHRKHALAKAKLQHLWDFQEMSKRPGGMVYDTVYGHSTTLGGKIRAALATRQYSTALDPATAACAEKLPWWQQDHWHWQSGRHQLHHVAS